MFKLKKFENLLIIIISFISGIISFYLIKSHIDVEASFILQLFYWSILFEVITIFIDECSIKFKKVYLYYNSYILIIIFIILGFLVWKFYVFLDLKKIIILLLFSLIQILYIYFRSYYRINHQINIFKIKFIGRNLLSAIIFYFYPSSIIYIFVIYLYTIIFFKNILIFKIKKVSFPFKLHLISIFYAITGAFRILLPINYIIMLPHIESTLLFVKFSILNNLYNIFINYIDSVLYTTNDLNKYIKDLFFLLKKNMCKIILLVLFLIIISYFFLVNINYLFNLSYNLYKLFRLVDIVFIISLIIGLLQHLFYKKRKYIISFILSVFNILLWSILFVN